MIASTRPAPPVPLIADSAVHACDDSASEILVPTPEDQAGIEKLRCEIDVIDTELVRLIQRRTAISHAIGAARRSLGGTRIVYSREMAVLKRNRPSTFPCRRISR